MSQNQVFLMTISVNYVVCLVFAVRIFRKSCKVRCIFVSFSVTYSSVILVFLFKLLDRVEVWKISTLHHGSFRTLLGIGNMGVTGKLKYNIPEIWSKNFRNKSFTASSNYILDSCFKYLEIFLLGPTIYY